MIERTACALLLLSTAVIAAERDAVVGADAARTRVSVQPRQESYAASALIGIAREYLLRQLREERPALARIEVEPVGEIADLRVPSGDVTVRPRPIRAGSAMSKRVCVWLDVNVNGKLERSVPVWLAVKAYAPALVAKRAIKPREKTGLGSFAVEERDVAEFGNAALATDGDLIDKRARTFIPAGAVVRIKDLERNPSVLAEEMVDVRVLAGPIFIETQAVAEQDGYIGDRVRMRNPTTASIFTARVVGEKAVVVTER
jgi:flagella basal body P-ring formation protein FlgA